MKAVKDVKVDRRAVLFDDARADLTFSLQTSGVSHCSRPTFTLQDQALDFDYQVQTKNVGYLKFVRKHIRKPYKTFAKFSNSTKKNPKQLHSLRIAGKKLRYALELMPNEDTNCSLEKCRTSLKKIQKKLGDFTDHTAASEILNQIFQNLDTGQAGGARCATRRRATATRA